jgi:hypothetical protein
LPTIIRRDNVRAVLIGLGAALGGLLLLIGLIIGIWALRPNRSQVDPALAAEIWPVVRDGFHNSNTHLIQWNGYFYLVYARSRFHMGDENTRLIVLRSADGRNWEEIAVLTGLPGEDIRDPKLTVIDDRLLLYALPNTGFEPEPYGTVVATSDDGITWTSFDRIEPQGWLLWEPKSLDGETWYATAYWHEHGKSALFQSTDGLEWEYVSAIHEGDRNDETANEFLTDGKMLVTARLEGNDRAWHQGSKKAATLLAVADPPYTDWATTQSLTARLDGPALFNYNGRVYAVGRFDPEGHEKWYGGSSLIGRKRTAIYEVTPEELIHLSDFPSAGDTSYAGAVIDDGYLYASYYTSNPGRDYTWALGLILPSDIMMARVPLANLERLADSKR